MKRGVVDTPPPPPVETATEASGTHPPGILSTVLMNFVTATNICKYNLKSNRSSFNSMGTCVIEGIPIITPSQV